MNLLILTDKEYFIKFNNFDNVVKKYQKLEVSTLKKELRFLS